MINHQQSRHHHQILDTKHLKHGTILHRKNIRKLSPPQRQISWVLLQRSNGQAFKLNLNQYDSGPQSTCIHTD